jgi:predicted alpha/beta-fold hydrolase
VLHSRGIQSALTTPTYHSALTYQDFIEAIDQIQEKHQESDLFGVGISLGANYMMNVAANEGCKLKAVVSISNPYNIEDV